MKRTWDVAGMACVRALRLLVVFLALAGSSAWAATEWNTKEYDLYPGDFDGDGKTDVLYVAKDVSRASGIAKSDGSGPNIPWQSWPSNYLGIPWSSGTSKVIVADFNGDNRSDILLQRSTPGDHYLLLADAQGKFVGIHQTIGNSYLSLSWSASEHVIVAGDFTGDGRADVFLQATQNGTSGVNSTNYLVFADANGQLTILSSEHWTNGHLGLNWSTRDAIVYAGNFNGQDPDGLWRDDLLVQARPKSVMIDFDPAFPVPVHAPGMNGIAHASDGTSDPIFALEDVDTWSRKDFGADWSPQASSIVIGDFNGDGIDDVLLQARTSSKSSYLAAGNHSGAPLVTASALASNVSWSASGGQRLIAGNFDGSGGAGIYLQAGDSAGSNSIAQTITGSSVSLTTHNPTAPTGVLPATAVGHTVGSFAVSSNGAASYSIGVAVPPGIAGIQPQVSINYASGAGNGLLGVGWFLNGFSEIERCGRTLVQDGATGGVLLVAQDSYCLDGNKLRLTGGTYGAAESTYGTENETFAKITAKGAVGSTGPSYFIVESKDGLIMEYGNTADSKIEAVNTMASTTPHTWALNKVSDPHGNTMTISYEEDGAPNGSFRPSEMLYTSNANAGRSAVYKLRFEWVARPSRDTPFAFIGGSSTKETKRLDRIETRYYDQGTWRLVRKYQLSYNASGATPNSRLASIQECDSGGACLAPTIVSWYDGLSGWQRVSDAVNTTTGASALLEAAYPVDLDGDSRTDLVYPQTVASTTFWYGMKANSSGQYSSPVATAFVPAALTPQYVAIPIDYAATGRQSLLTALNGYSDLQLLEWDSTSNSLVRTPTNLPATNHNKQWTGDFNGDGRDDYAYAVVSGGTANFYVRTYSGVSGGVVQFAAAGSPVYSMSVAGTLSSASNPSFAREADFNGDGRSDLLVRLEYKIAIGDIQQTHIQWRTLLSSSSGYTESSWSLCMGAACYSPEPAIADFNGDGYTDLMVANASPGDTYSVYYGSSLGFTSPQSVGATATIGSSHLLADYDGDGRTDLLYPSGSTWVVRRAMELGFEAAVATNIPTVSSNLTHRAIDLDGDGKIDIGYKDGTWKVQRHLGSGVSDVVKSIKDGYGNTVSVNYAPLTDSQVYTKGTGAVFPAVDLVFPMYVVKSYTATDGAGGEYTVTENYAQARAHVQGRGFQGFGSRTSTDGRTGLKTVTQFFQDYPYTGTVDRATVYQPNGTTKISETLNTPQSFPTSSGTNPERRYPYIYQSIQRSYEVGGAGNGLAIAETTTTNTVDEFGNPLTVSTVVADKTGTNLSYSSLVENTYISNDELCRWRGFITQQQVKNTVPNLLEKARTVQFVKDASAPQACRVYQQLTEPTALDASVLLTKTFGYDAFGHPTSETVSGSGITSRTTQSSFGTRGVFPETVTNALGQTASKTFDYALGVPLTATDQNQLTTYFQYDGFGRLQLETRPDGTKTLLTYSACTQQNNYCGDSRLRYRVQRQELDATNPGTLIRQSAQLFDALGRSLYDESQTLSGAYAVLATSYEYDANGLLVLRRSAPYFAGFSPKFTATYHDVIGRPIKDERPIDENHGGLQTTLYSYNRLTHSHTDANGRTTTKMMNAIGQTVQTIDAANGNTYLQYDQFANLTKTIDPLGNEIRNQFNIRGFKTQTRDPDTGTWDYTYYPTGELNTQTDAKNQTVTLTYDALGRPLTRVEAEGTTSFTYGTTSTGANRNVGRLASVSSPGGFSEGFVYDGLGRLQTSTMSADATSFVVDRSYNTNTGLLETATYPTSTSAVAGSRFKVKYEYDYGLLKRTRDFNTPSTVYWEQVATNAAGQTIDQQLGNGLHTYSTYDGITGLLANRQAGSANQVQNLAYQWDKVGNLTKRSDSRLNFYEDFYYDALNRLDYSTLNGVATPNLDVGYDALGNITSKTGIGSYSYAASGTNSVRPHAVTAAGANSYAYDNNGNMTTRNGSTIAWTSYNLPSTINKGGNSSQFSYGADRQRFKQIAVTAAGGSLPAGTETTIYLGSLYERVTKPSGVVEHKHYIMAGDEAIAIRTLRSNAANDTRYLHKDHLGSVDTITDESGAVVQRLSYDAFGKRRSATAWSGGLAGADWTNIAAITHRAFTFHEQLDNVDLVHMNGRVYDPDLGRFISADPFIQAPLMSQSLNRYSYVMNNPLSLIDPSGYSWLSKAFKKAGRFFEKTVGVVGQVVASVVVVAVAVVACWGSQMSGCWPALATAAAQLGVIWGNSGSGGGGGARAPPSSGPGTFSRSSGVNDWVRDHGINGNAFGATVVSDPGLMLPSLPTELVDWFAGFGDALTFGLTRHAREATGIVSGDTSSEHYAAGHFNGAVASVLFSAGSAVVVELAALSRAAALRISGMLDVDLAANAARGLPPLRQAYVDTVSDLRAMALSLRAAGADVEALARTLHAERRAIGEQFKSLTPPDRLAEIYQRNLQKYGDKLGPTIDWLRAQGKTWDQIIDSATRTGGKDLGF